MGTPAKVYVMSNGRRVRYLTQSQLQLIKRADKLQRIIHGKPPRV